MGRLVYGSSSQSVEIEDRILAHLKVVMLTKLRRNEGFPFSYEYDVSAGSGRITWWVNPTTELQFCFDGSRPPALNKAWLEVLMNAANAVDGLRLLAEPDEDSVPSVPPPTESIPVLR